MAHARASASSAYRWFPCPGSVILSENSPEQTSSAYAEEGTIAHDKGAKAIASGEWTGDDAVDAYVSYVRSMSRPDQRMVEVDLTPALAALHPDLGGTADCIIVGHDWIETIDYKHGAGMFVSVEDNLQLKVYSLGALLTVNKPGIRRVRMTIVQPRIEGVEPIRTQEFDAFELLEFAADLVAAAERTTVIPPILKSGDHCRFCRAAGTCPELATKHTELMALEFRPGTDVALVAKGLDMIPALEAQIKGLRELAYNLAASNVPVPGYKLVEKRAIRKWKDTQSIEQIAPLEWFDRELKSVAQLEKYLGAQRFAATLAEHVEKKSSGFALVPDSDSRPPAQTVAALAADFEAADLSLIPGV